MENMIIYTMLLLWMFIALGFGIIEGNLFHKNPHKEMEFKAKYRFNIHFWFTFIRGLVVVPLMFVIWYYTDIIELTYSFAFTLFVFPFLHDGAYYHTRKDLSNGKTYPKGWWDFKDSSAILDFRWYTRTVLFVIAIIFLLPY